LGGVFAKNTSLETKFPSSFGVSVKGKNGKNDCHIKCTTDNDLQILLQESSWRVKTSNTILQIPWKKVKSVAMSSTHRRFECRSGQTKHYKHGISLIITPYIRMLDSNWLIAVIIFTNSGLALWICRILTSCRCICIRFNMIYLFNYTEYYLEHWLSK
jgi:hypothetical protein